MGVNILSWYRYLRNTVLRVGGWRILHSSSGRGSTCPPPPPLCVDFRLDWFETRALLVLFATP